MPAQPSLRERIAAHFSADELRFFCDDHFPDVGREFPDGMELSKRAQLLIARCARTGRTATLLDALERERPSILGDDREALLAELAALAALPEGEFQKIINATANQQFGDVSGVAVGVNIGGTINYHAPSLPPFSPRHQLRASVPDFVGRAEEIAAIVDALQPAAGGGAMAISGLRGMGGIGKTELAFAAAQRLAPSFPDAQIVLALRGASATPLTPEQALARVVQVFHPEAKLPEDLEQLKGLYASCLHGQRVLILADDARDAAQVRPLLPPPGCALLITSRQHFTLPGMVARNLDTLPPEDAIALLLAIYPPIGEHAAALAKLCGYLPLALRVSAGLLANSSRTVARFLEQLRAERLKHLEDPDAPDDPQASVAASLQLSYDALDAAQQTALSQLSVFPVSFDRAAAQAVLDAGDAGEALLDALVRRSLLEWDAASKRFDLHDLVRVYAAARLADEDAARLRHAQHYAAVVSEAQDEYLQGNDGVIPGLALFDRERAQIDAGWHWAIVQASVAADALLTIYAEATIYIGDLRYDKRRERIPQLDAALTAARRQKNRRIEGAWLGNLGTAHADLGDARRAIDYYEQALIVTREIGDRHGEGVVLGNLGNVHFTLGDARRAIEFHEQCLSVLHASGDRRGEGSTLGNLGMAHAALGDTRRAIEFYEQHLVIAREIGDRRGEGNALGNLGVAHAALGNTRRAILFYEQCLIALREIGDRRGEGTALGSLANAHAALGNARRAIEFYEQYLIIAREIGDWRGEALASWNFGLHYRNQGNLARAIELMQVYVDYLRELGHPDAATCAAEVAAFRQRLASGEGTSADES